ncbi:MAG: ferrochelatase, partial [Thermodesulfovibrionales bacterium]|nr:ferrochelatase [Thermodesulfovibrionales bacterium]
MAAEGHTAVVLLNLGGPDSLEAVRPFLYNLFSDRLIIRLGPPFMQKPLAWWIARKRAPISRGYYEQIGGASPLGIITQGQAASLESRMREHGDFRVYVGMRYWKPSIEDTLQQVHHAGASRVLALSLYPQYSIATTGSSEASFHKAAKRLGLKNVAAVPPWPTHPLYIDALEDLLKLAVGNSDVDQPHILFSAHSLPKSFIDEGDPYVDHIMATINALMD